MSDSERIHRKELADTFGNAVSDHPDVMAECLSLLRLYHLTAPDFFYKYEAFVLSRPSGLRAKLSTITVDSLKGFRADLQRQQQAKAVASMGGTAMTVPRAPGADQKSAVGVKKTKGRGGDLENLLGSLATPMRPSKGISSISSGVGSPSATNQRTPASTNKTDASGSLTTPQRPSPLPSSASSYRPDSLRVSSSTGAALLSTPTDKTTGGLVAPSSPLSPSDGHVISSQPLSFQSRTGANSLVETLNPHLPSWSSLEVRPRLKPRVELSSTINPADYGYRYMFEKISERSEALDDLIDEYAESIKDAYGLSELGDPHFVSDESIYTVGRILSSATSSKVDKNTLKTSFHLQSSRLIGAGKRIALELPEDRLKVRGGAHGVKGFSLYPGCLICAKGRNGGGGKFVVEEVLLSPPDLLPQTSKDDLLSFQHGEKLNGHPISLTIAAGPFTLDDDLLYEPLEALVAKVIEEKPDVFLLLGPFVDSRHPAIISCAVTQTPADLFRDQISKRLQRILENSPGTVIILVPSIHDVVSQHMAFPQSMLTKDRLGLPKKVKVLPNPCSFSVNEVLVAVSTVDILFHLGQTQVSMRAEEADPDPELKGAAASDTFAGYIRQVLGQRSFYPLYPPPEDLAGDVNLDVTHYSLLKMDQAPDILILPGKLNRFSKIVDSTLVINPSYLARPRAAGHFAKVSIHSTPKKDLEGSGKEGDDMLEHHVWDRARSEIWKI